MGHRPKKSLGQNFLKSKQALSQIVEAADITANDIVLEIGPGKGVLTEKLLFFGGKVVAVEKDRELIEVLKEKFKSEIENNRLDLIEGDILEFDPKVLSFYKDLTYKVVANIPYYITGAILRKFLEGDHKPESMVLLVQKEVAERIVAKGGKESILSLSVKAFGAPKYVAKVPKKYFSPAPKVDSAIISIEDISTKRLKSLPESAFFEVVKAGFAHKRKILIKNLETLAQRAKLDEIFEKLSISKKVRSEDVPFESWAQLSGEIADLKR